MYKLSWVVMLPTADLMSYDSYHYELFFKEYKPAFNRKKQLIKAFKVLGFTNASTYVKLTELTVL